MAGFPTTGGWRLLHSKTGGVDLYPATDAPVVARMRAAGAVILGKTNIPVLSATGSHANDSWAGPTYNAAGREFLPGGSSAGTATSVAASLAVLGLAEETGGSIQNPASAQALVGIKPTHGLVPNAGVLPLSSLRDVVGPIARCVRDAALTLDALAGLHHGGSQDHRRGRQTAAGRLRRESQAGRAQRQADRHIWPGLAQPAAVGRRRPRSTGGRSAKSKAQGAILVEDPFAGSGFADLRAPTMPGEEYDARGLESLPYDLGKYLERLGPDAALKTFAEFAAATKAEDPFAPSGVLSYMPRLPAFNACLADPTKPPDMSAFIALREKHLAIFNEVFARHRLDAVVFPQMREQLAAREAKDIIHETTVSEINIAGLPGVTVPAGYYASGSPFNLIAVGPMWSEAELLGIAFAYEQATHHRKPPVLSRP